MDIIIGAGVRGIATGIGLASEGVSAYKAKKHSKHTEPNNIERDQPAHEQFDRDPHETDEEIWELDAAQEKLMDHKELNSPVSPESPRDPTILSESFFIRNQAPPSYDAATSTQRLPYPVILPQRRPKDRSRGFIRAYAPVLNNCGISQDAFLDFLNTFDKASQASEWVQVVNFANIAGIAVTIGKEVEGRSKTNTFLEKINNEFFKPKRLYCLVMTWNPESDSTHEQVNLTSKITELSKPATSKMDKIKRNMRSSNGNTYGDMELLEAAPLVFPALEDLAGDSGEEAAKKKSSLKKGMIFVEDFFDRRAQAKYAMKNPDAVLAQKNQTAKFTSRYSDPSHPAASGNLFSLISGGHFNPPSLRSSGGQGFGRGFGGRRGLGYDDSYGYGGREIGFGGGFGDRLSGGRGFGGGYGARNGIEEKQSLGRQQYQYGQNSMYGGNSPLAGGPLGLVGEGMKKVLKKNVLYLMIVNMPSDEEMAEATMQEEGYVRQFEEQASGASSRGTAQATSMRDEKYEM